MSRADAGLLRRHAWKPETLKIASLLSAGKTPQEIRNMVAGARGDTIRRIAKRIGIKPFQPGSPGIYKAKDLAAMKAMRSNGFTYAAIAQRLGGTRQRVHKLLNFRGKA